MRLLSLTRWILLGGGALWLYASRRSSDGGRAATARSRRDVARDLSSDLAPDLRDPVQGLDEAPELRVTELDLDAMSREDAEAASDLAALETDLDERNGLDDEPVMVRVDDVGELYGVHTPVAFDREIPDDDTAFEVGENWIESLQARATEFGPEPEEDVDVVDDADVPPHPSDRRDTPVADHGAAGRRGL